MVCSVVYVVVTLVDVLDVDMLDMDAEYGLDVGEVSTGTTGVVGAVVDCELVVTVTVVSEGVVRVKP